MMKRLASTFLILAAVTGAGCKKSEAKKDEANPSPVADPAAANAPTPAPTTDPTPAPTPAPTAGGCPAGLTDPGGIGACAKIPAGLKADPSYNPGSDTKGVNLAANPNTYVVIRTHAYKESGWEYKISDLSSGLEGVGGKVVDEGKIGDDGKWVLVDMEPSKSKATKSVLHSATTTVDCWAQGEVDAAPGAPSVADMLEICKSIVAGA